MEDISLPAGAPCTCYAAYIDTTHKPSTQGECVILLTDDYSGRYSYEKLSLYDFLPQDEFTEGALLHSLVDDYSLNIIGINIAPLGDDSGYGFRPKYPLILQAPFSLLCSFLSVDFKKFIEAFVDLLLLPFCKHTPNDRSAIQTKLERCNPISNLFPLDDEAEAFGFIPKTLDFRDAFPTLSSINTLSDEQLEKNSDKLRDELHKLRSDLISGYAEHWFDYILLQRYALSYAKQPETYGVPSRFTAFRQRYQIFDKDPYIPKMTADATTEIQYLFRAYLNQDWSKFDAALNLSVKRGSSLHSKTIVAKHLSVLLADILEMIINNHYAIKRCKLCGQYFVPSESNNIDYCLRLFKDKKTCRDIGPSIKAQEKMKKDAFRTELKRTYNRLRGRKERHPEQPEYARLFEQFDQEKKQLVQAYKTGNLSPSEVLSILDDWKKR